MRGHKVLTWRNYPAGSAPAEGPPGTVEIERPTARPTLEGMVLVPFFQAIIIGVTVGLLITWALVDWLKALDGWWPAGGLLVLACFGLAFVGKVANAEATLWTVERIIGADITGDQVVGKPSAHDHIIIAGPGASTMTPEERLRAEFTQFIQGCAVDTSMRRWERIIGREKYQQWRNGLIRLGWAEWIKDDEPKQGWKLTRPPNEIIEAVF